MIMPDIQKCGGLAEAKNIADLAHTYYVPIAPHCQASPIGMMAACHAMSTVPNFLVQEWHWAIQPRARPGGAVRAPGRHHREGSYHRIGPAGNRPHVERGSDEEDGAARERFFST